MSKDQGMVGTTHVASLGTASLGVSLFFLAAQVSHQLVAALPPWYFVVGGSAFAVVAAAAEVRPTLRSVRSPILHAAALAGSAALARALDVLDVFALAYTATPLILVWIEVLRRQPGPPLVLYDPTGFDFVLTRSLSYALLRSGSQVLVLRAGLPLRVALLVPFAFATTETFFMMVWTFEESYAFASNTRNFAVYATLKSAVFTALPLAEWALLGGL